MIYIEYEVVDGKYEYHTIELEDLSTKYIYVPTSIILNTELDIRRVAIFSFMKSCSGLDGIVRFTIPDMVEWHGGKPNNRTNGLNEKTLSTIDSLVDGGYLTYLTEKSKSTFMKCKFDTDYHYRDCKMNGYAAIYLDELEKIFTYKKENSKDSTINGTSILLVFAYLRLKINRRPNRLKPEETSPDKVKERRERLPDAFDSNINDIAYEINISSKTVSKIIDILEYDLSLIVTDRAFRVRNKEGEFRTLPTIFANAYKREDKYLLDTGSDYSRIEIELKAENMKQFYKKYKIDTRKRKKS